MRIEKDAVKSFIYRIKEDINHVFKEVTSLSSQLGELSRLKTTDKSNLVAAINEQNTNLANKVSSKSSATLSGLSIDAAQYPTFNFKVDGILKSAIFEYGASLTLRQYNADGTYSEVGVPVLINMKNSVASHGTSISNLESNALLYKGDVTNGLTETVASGIYTYDAANCANVPVTTGCGTIVSFGFGTTLCYRLCLTSASGVYYSVYIPGTTYGTWTKL
ncbi:MAG: hypothetical protein HFG96_12430 [Lachnospiraceae bacterium]|jgi:hypothetical protein|nr:hypothetical protein [Lachnospiraceae bacterium]